MDSSTPVTRELVLRSAVAILVCAVLVAICYFFVDRPVAWFVHDHVPHWRPLVWPTLVPPILVRLAPLAFVVAIVWRAWRPGNPGPLRLLALALSLIVAVAIKDQLKWVFGRYWPETWVMQNPSLIQDGAYGFHPFHEGIAYESFPSGHTTVVCSLISVAWILWPRWRWLWSLAGLAVVAGLLGLDYHFVGDVVAGAFLGSITGLFSARLLTTPGD
jgi:membrane-associated phospholipid phosphatase